MKLHTSEIIVLNFRHFELDDPSHRNASLNAFKELLEITFRGNTSEQNVEINGVFRQNNSWPTLCEAKQR